MAENQLMERAVGVLKLDIPTYEEIEHDDQAIGQAAMIVAVAGLVSGIVRAVSNGTPIYLGAGTIFGSLLSWYISSWVVYKVGTGLFKADATHREMLNVMGFAQLPGLLGICALIPGIGWLGALVGFFWVLTTHFIAVRQGLDVNNFQTVITLLVVFLIYALIFAAIFAGFAMLLLAIGAS